MPMEKVTFEPNTPVAVRLKYPVGKIVSGVYGEQVYYSTQDGKAMYLDLHVGKMINDLTPKVGEPILIMKKWSGKKTDRAEWHVWRDDGSDRQLIGKLAESQGMMRASQLGQQKDGTFVVPGAGVSAPAPASSATTPPSRQAQQPITDNGNGTANSILAEAKQLTDTFAAAWKYAREKYDGQVKPEEVRSFVLTAYIQGSKYGGRSNA